MISNSNKITTTNSSLNAEDQGNLFTINCMGHAEEQIANIKI